MATEIITRITDDLDGSKAAETVKFALDSVGYEIDLNDKNAATLREFLQKYIDSGTRVGRVSAGFASNPVGRPRTSSVAASNRDQNKAIRAWAIQAGYQLSERGRIPQTIQDAFADRHATRTTTATLFQEPAKQEVMVDETPEQTPATKAPVATKQFTRRAPKKTAPATS